MVAKIEFIEQVIDRMEKATALNLSTPNRQGGIVVLDAGNADEVTITGDLHGHRKNFNQIRKLADLAGHPRRHLIMQEVVHGGPRYENGGCMSHSMLEDVAKLKIDFPDRFHFLLSNHELSELTDYPIQKGGTLLNLSFRLGLHHMYGPALDRVLASYHKFIRSCPLAVRIGDGAFASHSAPESIHQRKFDMGIFSRELTGPDIAPQGGAFELVWGRDYSADNAQAFAELVGATVLLHGHEPTDAGYATPNHWQVIFDCCHTTACYAMLPTGEALNQKAVTDRIRKL